MTLFSTNNRSNLLLFRYSLTMKKILFSVILSIGLIGSSSAIAEYNSLKLGEGAGGYLIINDLSEKINNSVCGYATNMNHSFDEALDEIFLYLNENDKREINKFLKSQKFKKDLDENSQFINEFLVNGKKDGLDEKTLCGMLITIVTLTYEQAQIQWDFAKENYSK
jgi:hypothetical protein